MPTVDQVAPADGVLGVFDRILRLIWAGCGVARIRRHSAARPSPRDDPEYARLIVDRAVVRPMIGSRLQWLVVVAVLVCSGCGLSRDAAAPLIEDALVAMTEDLFPDADYFSADTLVGQVESPEKGRCCSTSWPTTPGHVWRAW